MTPRRRALAVVIAVLSALALISPANAASGAWTRQATVNPAGQEVWLGHVSCLSASDCEAVGTIVTSTGRNLPLAERWNGSAWTRQTIAPIAGSAGVTWYGVSCVAASNCEAVGGVSRSAGAGGSFPLAERWNGSRWVRQAVPNVAGNAVWFDAVSCVSATSCEAVGVEASTVNLAVWGAFAERWNGAKWVRQTIAKPSGGQQAGLNTVSCVRGAGCEALGTYLDASSHMLLLAERWNGTNQMGSSAGGRRGERAEPERRVLRIGSQL